MILKRKPWRYSRSCWNWKELKKNILWISSKVVIELHFFPKYIIYLIHKYSIRNQINVFEVSFSINNLLYIWLLKKKKNLGILGKGSGQWIIFSCCFNLPTGDCPPCAKLWSSVKAQCKWKQFVTNVFPLNKSIRTHGDFICAKFCM